MCAGFRQRLDWLDWYGVSALGGIGLLALFMDGYPFGRAWIYDVMDSRNERFRDLDEQSVGCGIEDNTLILVYLVLCP
jgi:hypothetical protein